MTASAEQSVQIVRHGDKLAVVFDASFLKDAGIDESSELNVRKQGNTISFDRAGKSTPEFAAAMRKVHAEWADVFKKLAE